MKVKEPDVSLDPIPDKYQMFSQFQFFQKKIFRYILECTHFDAVHSIVQPQLNTLQTTLSKKKIYLFFYIVLWLEWAA